MVYKLGYILRLYSCSLQGLTWGVGECGPSDLRRFSCFGSGFSGLGWLVASGIESC